MATPPRSLRICIIHFLFYVADEGDDDSNDSATDSSSAGTADPSTTETSSPDDSDSAPSTSMPSSSTTDILSPTTPAVPPVISNVPGLAANQTLNQQQLDQLKISCSGLQQWYTTLGGPQWLDSTEWANSDTTSCCSWAKVHCNPVGGIIRMYVLDIAIEMSVFRDMSYNNLTGGLPDSIAAGLAIQTLNFNFNKLSGQLPASLGSMPVLASIHLTNNAFNGTIPDSWANLPLLKTLDLSNNQLSGPFPASIANYRSLVLLSLSSNAFTGSLPNNIGIMPSLKSLRVSKNQLTGPIPDSLGNITALVTIHDIVLTFVTSDLTRNKLTGSIPPQLGNLVRLRNLYVALLHTMCRLSRNELNGAVPAELGMCGQLQILTLNYNALSGTFPSIVAPPALAFCHMQPNSFDACPPDDVSMNYSSMAFQCSVNCTSTKHIGSDGTSVSSNVPLLLTVFVAVLIIH
ncbi:hypothetical protein INT44_000860 [Umbelopsis vinacea]|uniref:Leucine-rich repeat-containing N-terminal plant-type domain-containing protein n=1 Tax=Umbelopsis vinacea TaxID=44442 RepID=A0A8H7URB8_9FUNG|nr:hypothetical protein INT44_000860 [Umbelopsis vinacea]